MRSWTRRLVGRALAARCHARCRLEQPADFLDTHHRWQFARKARQDQAARQLQPIDRLGEEEAQRRDRAVDRGRSYREM